MTTNIDSNSKVKQNRRILLITYFFTPEKSPRAFRTYELARELSKRGYDVEIVIPDYEYDYTELCARYDWIIHKVPTGFLINKKSKSRSFQKIQSVKQQKLLSKLFQSIFYLFYLGGRHFEYSFTLIKELRSIKKTFAMLISIGLPISVHVGTSLSLRLNPKLASVKIADYGDPFSFNPDNQWRYIHKRLEKWILKAFDFITVPTSRALKSFEYFKEKSRIKVIPQGFDLNEPVIPIYHPNSIPTFGYAGVFYSNIRNPKNLFSFLTSFPDEFKFILYTDLDNYENRECIDPYVKALEGKLLIKPMIDREQCIIELSKMDFLINMENKSKSQVPSKLIDYYLAGRPVFTFSMELFDKDIFRDFLEGNYSNGSLKDMEISDYDIRNIVQKILNLLP
jgi:hypothetical protein